MFRSRFARTIGLGMTIAALVASTAGAQPTDLRTPDAPAAGEQQQTTTQYTPSDVRTPDAVASSLTTTKPGLDMRTADAKDHGEGRGTFSAPDVTVVKVIDPAPTATGFDWGDAGIGAGGLLGLALIALGGTAIVARRKQRRTPSTV